MIENLQFERHMARHNLRPERREIYRGMEVLLAESGPHPDPENDPMLKDEWRDFPHGYYAAVSLVREKIATWVGVIYFDANHDRNMTAEGRKQARINAAFKAAREHVDIVLDG